MAENGTGGLKILSYDCRDYGKQLGKALELEKIGRKQLEYLQMKAYLRFYIRPNKFLTLFKNNKTKSTIILFVFLVQSLYVTIKTSRYCIQLFLYSL